MIATLVAVLDCVQHAHDERLMVLAGLVCAVGIYASFAIGHHAARATGALRLQWGAVSVLASGCTAWATHFIVLLAFKPRMPAAFDPLLTAASLSFAVVGIGAGVAIAIRARRRWMNFAAGLTVGAGVAALHYVGQAAYLVPGTVVWNLWLVVPSIIVSLPISGAALAATAHRNRHVRSTAAPLLIVSIAILHFCGMAAMSLHYDATKRLPDSAVSPGAITPIVAGVSFALIVLAVFGWRFDLAAKARLRLDRQRLRELADVALEGLLICNGDVILTANDTAEAISGRSAGTLTGGFVSTLLPGLDLPSLPQLEEREAELVGADGQAVPVRVLRRDVMVGHKSQTVIAVRDQRERLRTEARLQTLAYNDALTGLPNRARFFDLLALQAASRREGDRDFAVLMIDLDRFKPVNDMLGHAAGDIVLRMVADRLRAYLRDDDVVARLGGDEFAVVQRCMVGYDTPEMLAARLVTVIEDRPFAYEGQAIHLSTSIGIALAPHDGTDPSELMRNADLALYAAKADGRGTYRRYDPELDEKARERREMEEGLRRAISDHQLELHYQPLIDAVTGRITSAEALVRWNHPVRGLIPPAEFIGLAEETGLILPLGAWVLRTACAEAATWPAGMSVAVNLSPVQFCDRSLVSTIKAALAAAMLPASRLELEITEGVLLKDEKGTLDTLLELRALGTRISMDDFGTGYSSLSYLRKFPFDKIKIDQSFVRQLPADDESAAIVRAIITMGKCLGMTTTVEGVETAAQLDFSVAEGCNAVQGYLISRPLNPHAFRSFVQSERATARHHVDAVEASNSSVEGFELLTAFVD